MKQNAPPRFAKFTLLNGSEVSVNIQYIAVVTPYRGSSQIFVAGYHKGIIVSEMPAEIEATIQELCAN